MMHLEKALLALQLPPTWTAGIGGNSTDLVGTANDVDASFVLLGKEGHRTNMIGQFSFSQKYLLLFPFTIGSPHSGQLTIFSPLA